MRTTARLAATRNHARTTATLMARRGSPQPNQDANHRDTEDTEKNGSFKTGSLRDLGVSVVSGLPPINYHGLRATRRIKTLEVLRSQKFTARRGRNRSRIADSV